MSKVLKLLKSTRELLSDKARWTQGAMARDSAGVIVGTSFRDAVCWCLIGAIEKCVEDECEGRNNTLYNQVYVVLHSQTQKGLATVYEASKLERRSVYRKPENSI